MVSLPSRFTIIDNYSPKAKRLSMNIHRDEVEPETNNCFSLNTQVIIPKTKRKGIVKHEKNLFHP